MDEWIELLVTCDEIEAQIIKNILDGENIPVIINSLKIRPYPVNIGKIGEIKVLVRQEDEEKAKEVIQSMQDQSSEKEVE